MYVQFLRQIGSSTKNQKNSKVDEFSGGKMQKLNFLWEKQE